MICYQCGAHSPDHVTRGPLSVQLDPPAVYWRGVRQPFAPQHTRALHLLCERGTVSHLALALAVETDDDTRTQLAVMIYNMRKRLPRAVRIEAIKGWGYKLEIDHE